MHSQDSIYEGPISLSFPNCRVTTTVVPQMWDRNADWVLLQFLTNSR